jgi:hypothetical protein
MRYINTVNNNNNNEWTLNGLFAYTADIDDLFLYTFQWYTIRKK